MGFVLPRLAIGLSQNPDTFDHSAVLPVCYSDPPSLRGPALVKVSFQDHADPVYSVREVTSFFAPREFRRTGYGTRFRWLIGLAFETMSSSIQSAQVPGSDIPELAVPLAVVGNTPADNALLSLASAFGRSSPGGISKTPSPDNPPYMFLTTEYQTTLETWWPVELSSNGASTVEQPVGPKTFLRTMEFELTTRKTYKSCRVRYAPAMSVHTGTGLITGMSPPAPGRTTATLTLSAALRSDVGIGDHLLLYFKDNGPFVFNLFTINTINNPRTTVTVTCVSPPWPYGVPGGNAISYWSQTTDPLYYFPTYQAAPFVPGDVPLQGFTPNIAVTQLIGDQV